jgi:tetratricopeptide (TPR) repeat protein
LPKVGGILWRGLADLVNLIFHLVNVVCGYELMPYLCAVLIRLKYRSMQVLLLLLCGMAFSLTNVGFSQDTTRTNAAPGRINVKSKKLSSTADELETLLKDKAKPELIAAKYEQLAREFKVKGDNNKAIQYFNKAAEYFAKAKKNEDESRVLREAAQLLEQQGNMEMAIDNFQRAALSSNTASNTMDAQRVAAPTTEKRLEISEDIIQGNISLKEDADFVKSSYDYQEEAIGYFNRAQVSVEADQEVVAVASNIKALKVLEEGLKKAPSDELVVLNSKTSDELADLYERSNRLDEALEVKRSAYQVAMRAENVPLAVQNSIDLAELYRKNNQHEEALLVLKEAYRLSLSSGRTKDARAALLALTKHFDLEGKLDDKVFFYQDFIAQLDDLIARDSSMIDEKIFLAKEERIEQLEIERDLQDQLLDQSRNWNYGMIAFFALLLLGSTFLFWSFLKVRMKNKKIALQSLRREMNPHFIFNSLNSVNRFIAQNDEIKANNYLTSYAQLMRSTMEISSEDFIRLDKEIELLRKYLELEHLRFGTHFDFEIVIDENLDMEDSAIPGFLLQPHIENAIWHGLRYRKEKGALVLSFQKVEEHLLVTIEDNGIGVEESKKLKTSNQKSHKSRGFSNIKERIDLLNSLYRLNIKMELQSPVENQMGTRVKYRIPLTKHHE